MRIDMASSSLCNSQKPWPSIKHNAATFTLSISYLCDGQEQEEQVVSGVAGAVDSQGRHSTVPSSLFSSVSSHS